MAGVEVGVHAGEFDGKLLGARRLAVLADAEHRVTQTTDEELSNRELVGCCPRSRERDVGGGHGRESQELPSPHGVVTVLPMSSPHPRAGKARVRGTRSDRISVSGLCRGRSGGEPELLGRDIERVSEASEHRDVGQRGEAPLVPGDLGGGVTDSGAEIS